MTTTGLFSLTDRIRFEGHIERRNQGTCWIWTAGKNACGYGYTRMRGRQGLAHRFAYELYVSSIPAGMCVCHRCDNPACVNPAHLFVGSHLDNIADMDAKGRRNALRGEAVKNAKLNARNIVDIRKTYESKGVSQQKIADHYGVSQRLISSIVRQKAWTQVK